MCSNIPLECVFLGGDIFELQNEHFFSFIDFKWLQIIWMPYIFFLHIMYYSIIVLLYFLICFFVPKSLI